MKGKAYRLIRGFCVLCALICSLMIGAYMIGSVSDYTVLINNVLGVNSASAGSVDSYAFTSEFDSTAKLLTERKRVAEQIGEEGCVLLKNNGALPLRAVDESRDVTKNVTVLGSRAYTYDASGNLRDETFCVYGGIVGSPIRRQTVTTTDGKFDLPITLEVAFKSQNININPALVTAYSSKNFPALPSGSQANGEKGGPFNINEPGLELSECGATAQYSDACFVMIGRASGEGREYFPGEVGIAPRDPQKGIYDTCGNSALALSDNERNLIEVASRISDKVIVLVNSAVAMEIDDIKSDERVDAILHIGLPGAYGMNGVARVISGEVSPSGHLSDTYAVDASASPAAQNFGVTSQDGSGSFIWSDTSRYNNADNSHYVVLAEDLYTGYYYYETRYADCVEDRGNASGNAGLGYGATSDGWKYEDEMAYPFGYGLSYTDFTQKIVPDSLSIDMENKTGSVEVTVTNTGDRAAKSVIQLYAQSPYTKYDIAHGVEKSAVQLISFEKIDTEPNVPVTVNVDFDLKYLASYDKTVAHDGASGGYILEVGDYYFAVGNGAHAALNNMLLKKGVGEADLYVEEGETLDVDGVAVWTPDGVTFDENGVNASLFGTSESGVTVKNQLSDADYNNFVPDTVKYLSRSKWTETFPKAYTGLAVTSDMYDYLDSRVYKFGTGSSSVEFGVDHSEEEDDEGNALENLSVAEMKLTSFDDERWEYLTAQITFDEAWAFSPYGGASCKLFKSVNAPEVWQIDGPNGNVTRSLGSKAPSSGTMAVSKSDPNYDYMSCDMPAEPMVAATFDKELIERQGEMFGEDMMWSRNPIAWSPGTNLHRTPFNSRNHEYYSEDPMLTNILGVSCVRGGLKKGAILSAKHFAFNTQESFREGLCQFMEEQSARELELRAYQGLCEDINYVNSAGNTVNAIGLMSSFSRVGACGVNAHTGLMKNILRGEWGYKGLISTDMVVGGRFFNPQDSIINNVTFMATSNAENLLANFWPDYNNKSKVKNDPAMCEALMENMHYYMYSIANSSALNGYDANSVITEQMFGWQYALIALAAVFGAATLGLAAWACVVAVKGKKKSPAASGASDQTQGGENNVEC